MPFPIQRLRRLRASVGLRDLVRETHVTTDDLVLPLFVAESAKTPMPVASMPGVSQLDLRSAVAEAEAAWSEGIRAVLLFGIPEQKDTEASGGWAEDGVVQRAVRAIKRALPELVVITDVCLCEYMDHGHCGIVGKRPSGVPEIQNDPSLELLAKVAVSHARAGADIIAPSDMMDGRVAAIRGMLDANGFAGVPIMSYAAKFASAFYGPFRDAAGSAPSFGDRRSYQMDAANAREALREMEADVEEGADMLMVKPGLAYLDILQRARQRFEHPLAVYNVSGEYAMVKAAAANGWLEERAIVMEQMTAFKRAGADIIITYWARDVAGWLRQE